MEKPTISNCPKCGVQLNDDLTCPNGHGNFGPKQLVITALKKT